ncbi:hypothetical protein SCHPADRAFT_893987 [Schizopora paradoxa]|uniref:Uncharacterized protein n=1 Tax=Schizopora paradoxa TaxID=27342 RepID=A0A0H2RA85_9AGAM|nr:hypothetical protein SCHPADRAFT_893987 [Schizopora paradoxa]
MLKVVGLLERASRRGFLTHPEFAFKVEDLSFATNRYFMSKVLQTLSTSASDLLDVYTSRPEPYWGKLENGSASLPDELLSSISHLATFSNVQIKEDKTPYQSMLSHISRRIQRIVLNDKAFWSTIHLKGIMTKEKSKWLQSRDGIA